MILSVKNSMTTFGAIALLSGCASDHSISAMAGNEHPLRCEVTAADLESPAVKAHLQDPANAALTVVKGAVDKEGPLEFIISAAPNTRYAPNYHLTDEAAVVISGAMYIGDMRSVKNFGVMDTSVATRYGKGDPYFVPARVVHWSFTKDEPVVAKACTQGPLQMFFLEKSTDTPEQKAESRP